jgi:TP901 family phage tail tape measure protein
MAEQDLNVGINATTNFPSVVQKVVKSVDSLQNNLDDLVGSLQDLVKFQDQYASSADATAKATKNVGKATQEGVKSVNSLRDALSKTGKEGAAALNAIDLKKLQSEFSQLSSGEIQQLSKQLNEAGSSLSNFLSGEKIDLNLAPAVAQLNELQELLNKPVTPISDFSSAEDAFQEMRRLNTEFRKEVAETFSSLTDTSQSAKLAAQFEPINQLKQTLKDIQGSSGAAGIAELLNFEEASAKSQQLILDVNQIKNKLIEIGPAAQSGNGKAIAEFVQLSAQLKKSQSDAEKLGQELQKAQSQFNAQTGSANAQLGSLGFREIKLNDIFPSEEQQKVAQLQQKIDNAVRESINEGAVKKTLNLFLAQDRQIQSVDRNIVALTSHLPRLRYALYDVSNSAKIFGGAIVAAIGATVKVAADYERAFADVVRTTSDGAGAASTEMQKLRDDLVNLSQDIPVSFADLAEIATLAGQLNIATESVGKFTSAVAKFSATTDVTIDSAATAFGRLDQLVDGVNGQFEKLGSAILKVGVNAVATESDIIAISSQIASVANIAGFSAAELVGFSSALASVGTRPELARGTFTRLFTEIQEAVAGGGDKLEDFARIANQSTSEFASAWGAGSGPEQVIAILEGLNAAGTDADGVLRQLGITSVRDVPTLLKLAQGVEQVKDQINLAKIGFEEGTELQEQYSVITETLTERIAVLKNNLSAVVAAFGSLSGPIGIAVEALSKVLNVIEFIASSKVGSFIIGVSAIFASFAGIAALVVSALASLGAGLAAGATAMTELYSTTALAKIQIAQLGETTDSAAVSELKKASAVRQTNLAQAKANLTTAKSVVSTRSATVNTVRYSTSLNVLKARLQVAGASVVATTSRIRLFGVAAANAARQTRLYGVALNSLKNIRSVGIFIAVSAGVEFLINKMSELNKETEDLSERFEDWGSILEAVKQDSRDFANATAENIGQFTVIGNAVNGAEDEISNYSRALAVASGEESALASLLDDSSDAFDRQTIAIGKNTRAILAQRLAKELAAAAETPTAFGEFAIGFKATLFDGPSGAEQAFQEINQSKALDALISTFGTDLSLALQESGFSYKDWSDAIISGNRELADSFANNLTPAATKLADALQAEDATKYAEQIETLRTIADGGSSALINFASSNDEVTAAVRQAKIEIEATGGIYSEAESELRDFQEALSGVVDAAYAQVNAERAMSESITRLGGVFQEQGAGIAATSQEMQTAISDIINAASSEEDAVAGLSGFYSAIVDGGYASADQLEILEGVIISTYRTAAATQIAALRDMRNALDITKALARASGSDRSKFNMAIAGDAEVQNIDKQIKALQDSMDSIDSIADTTGNAAESAALLARGYQDAEQAAKKTAGAAEDVADETENAVEEVRTLLDYASDLESVFSRAFDIRFGASRGIDDIADAWLAFTEQVESAQGALEELQATQEDLGADRAIKEYFLSVAEAYSDTLRAATLRNEIADLDRKQAENAKALAEASDITAGANSASSDSPQGRANRSALLGLVKNYQDYITVLAESGASQNELRAATNKARQEFVEQARELGFQEDIVQLYAAAFDDITTAINKVPRDVTIDFNADPALQALAELNAKLDQSIAKAKELNQQQRVDVGPSQNLSPSGLTPAQVTAKAQQWSANLKASNWPFDDFASGGYTGSGGKYEPAGIVHKGEYVIPQKYVNQSTGMPDFNFLTQLQNGIRGYAQGGFVGGGGMGDGTMMVELSPYDRKLLADAGNVQLRVDGKVVASATNRSNFNEARRGSN